MNLQRCYLFFSASKQLHHRCKNTPRFPHSSNPTGPGTDDIEQIYTDILPHPAIQVRKIVTASTNFKIRERINNRGTIF